jgi:GDPmannose 4,6-dehydratase
LGKLDCLELGNIDAKRDWGFAKEYVEGMWRMLQAKEPDTFVLATNRTETVRDFVAMAFKGVGIHVEFTGSDVDETAVIASLDPHFEQAFADSSVALKVGQTVMRVNPKFYRPAEVELLIGNPQKAKNILGWAPETSLERLCQMMVTEDVRRNRQGFSF